MTRTRVVLAEDHAMVAEGLRAVLEQEAIDVVSLVGDGRELLKAVSAHEPDLVITDLTMPRLNGVEAARQILKDYPRCKIIVVTMHADVTLAADAFRAGVHGFVLKVSDSSELVAAIHEVLQGKKYLTPTVTEDVLDFFIDRVPSDRTEALTSRQREVLQLIAEGASIKGIAEELNISPRTAESHRYAIMEELDLRTTAELTRFAIERGIV